jgi:hypothetical protein
MKLFRRALVAAVRIQSILAASIVSIVIIRPYMIRSLTKSFIQTLLTGMHEGCNDIID